MDEYTPFQCVNTSGPGGEAEPWWGRFRSQLLIDWNNFLAALRAVIERVEAAITVLESSVLNPVIPSSGFQLLAAGNTITSTGAVRTIGSAGVVTITSTPTIANGSNGQFLLLINTGSFNITLQDEGTLAGSNLELRAGTVAIAPYTSISLYYSSDAAAWVQVA